MQPIYDKNTVVITDNTGSYYDLTIRMNQTIYLDNDFLFRLFELKTLNKV